MAETDWVLSYDGFDPAVEGLREALCTLGNGYFATRGAAEEAEADEVHYPGTYLAGGYNRRVTELAGREIENEDLVNLPNWLPLTFRPEGGDWLNLRRMEILAYAQELDLQAGRADPPDARARRRGAGDGRRPAVGSCTCATRTSPRSRCG